MNRYTYNITDLHNPVLFAVYSWYVYNSITDISLMYVPIITADIDYERNSLDCHFFDVTTLYSVYIRDQNSHMRLGNICIRVDSTISKIKLELDNV